MRHVSLYRKWRPRTFDAVAGQEPVVRTLRRAIETGRVAHAYLFSGPRGTGKTSTAKVLAMGLNCVDGPTAEPDGTCESCRGVVNNSSMDVLEMDAASNRGIDEIRDLRDKVNLAPTQGRMKVYIIDEVHMLTTEAFNALLKMLEEPPEHVVFVLATTEKHKVPATIISRCQSFDFRRPGVTLLAEKLAEIAEAEGIGAEPEALTVIAREARGSFRDAEGLLDQLSSFSDGRITAEQVRELLGSVASEVLLETTDALYERRAAGALRMLDRLSGEGRDLSRFVAELISHLRRLMLLPDAPEVALAEVGTEERGGLEEQASRIPVAEVVRMIEALGDALVRARRGGDAKLEIELTFLKLARDYEAPQVENLLARLETLENAVSNGIAMPQTRLEPSADQVASSPSLDEEAPVRDDRGGLPVVERAVDEDREPEGNKTVGVGDLAARWREIVQDLRDRKQALTATVFQEGRPVGLRDEVLSIEFPADTDFEPDFYIKQAENPRHKTALVEVLGERLGSVPRLEFRVAGEPKANGESPPIQARPAPQQQSPVYEAAPEPAMPEPPQGEAVDEIRSGPVSEARAGEPSGERIQSAQEVLDLARELFPEQRG